jgi:hypothetical protein
LGTGNQMIVTGTNAVGVAIKAPVVGNGTVNGDVLMGAGATITGENATGLLVTAPVSGSVSTTIGISVAGTQIFTIEKVDPLAGSAVAIGASVSGGLLNAGSVADGDTTISSTLSSSGRDPAFDCRARSFEHRDWSAYRRDQSQSQLHQSRHDPRDRKRSGD